MKKTTFWSKDESNKKQKHLRFVISDPNADGKVLLVNMTTVNNTGREDLSCELFPGDHESVKHHSYIKYDRAFEFDSIKLLNEKFRGEIECTDQISEKVLVKIQDGARKSPALPEKFRSFFTYF